MADAHRLNLAQAQALAERVLIANRTSPEAAASTARALVRAEADGQAGHGLSRLPSYSAQTRVGKVDGYAVAALARPAPAALIVDAAHGFAYPAIDLAIEGLAEAATACGVAVATITRSHHFGQVGAHVERLAEQGFLAFAFANSPKAMAFHGGKRPMLGTNPLAFASPTPDGAPLVLDMALSEVARAKVVAAEREGRPIPLGWAVDSEGHPTTDAKAALGGAMVAMGGPKGAALALMVELLTGALAGGAYGWEASSFLDDKGPPPGVGQVLMAIDPAPFGGDQVIARVGVLLAAMAEEEGVRPPGQRRLAARTRAAAEGLSLSPAFHAELLALAGD
jgi:(2R)-3-sulfolactate dehydrogenase (NADP+)